MDYLKAIDLRRSRRKYSNKPLSFKIVDTLISEVARYNRMSGLSIQLITQNDKAFASFKKTYGMFSGVQNYLALVGDEKDELRLEKEGYYGEKLVLKTTLMGLGTCWVGTSYDQTSCACKVDSGQVLDCVIALGYVEDSFSMRERMVGQMIGKKQKSLEDLCTIEGTTEPWFYQGMAAVQKAPSSHNLQPVYFRSENGRVSAGIEATQGLQPIDLGIAKLHFEIGAGGGHWHWGNHAIYEACVG